MQTEHHTNANNTALQSIFCGHGTSLTYVKKSLTYIALRQKKQNNVVKSSFDNQT